MLGVFDDYTINQIIWIAISIFFVGLGKGGFPLGGLALPILILVWPQQATAARSVVAFLLPLLSAMDIFSLLFYRKHIQWRRIVPLIPGTLLGVAVASILFVSDSASLVALSDRVLKIIIASISLLFVGYKIANRWILKKIESSISARNPGKARSWVMGTAAGVLSTISHSAGPPIIMYFVPQELGKLQLAGTMAGFFWGLNLVKLLPFGLLGRLEPGNLLLGVWMIPIIPLGVGSGYLLVRLLKEKHYVGLIYFALSITSVLLIQRAIVGT